MKGFLTGLIIFVSTLIGGQNAEAKVQHGSHHHIRNNVQKVETQPRLLFVKPSRNYNRGSDTDWHRRDQWVAHPAIPWCGWWMRGHVPQDPGPSYNLARNWEHYGQPAPGPLPGVIGVLPHHVFMVVKDLGHGTVLAISGNDSNRVRTRPRSTSGVIAWRKIADNVVDIPAKVVVSIHRPLETFEE